jgi:hypothetical protein
VAATYATSPGDPNVVYRALAAFTATYLDRLGIEEGQALPALWDGCTDEELMSILVSFKGSRSDAESLASVLAQVATLNPPEVVRMVSVGLDPIPVSDLAEVLATPLGPNQLCAFLQNSPSRRS